MEDDVVLELDTETQRVTITDESPTVSVNWDIAAQEAVTQTAVGPTIGSRAYALTHTAIYDAWASYEDPAIGVHVGNSLQRPMDENTEANKAEAMSYAAYTVLAELFPTQTAIFDQTLTDLGFTPPSQVSEPAMAQEVGLAVAEAVMQDRRFDGSNQLDGYTNDIGYAPVNVSPLAIEKPSLWTPENVPIDPEDADPEQSFLTPQWAVTDPFALPSPSALRPPEPEPFFMPGVEADFDAEAGTITLADGTTQAISRDLIGTVINPGFIEQSERVVELNATLTDEQKLIAEFWEDAGGTSFPPGTFMTFGQFVSARDDNTLDQDAQLFFMLGNAVFDAGIATWEAKVHYDYVRPVRAIRELGEFGLIGEEGVDSQTGESGFVIDAWVPGQGTQTILAENFLTYQTPGSDPSPPFAEYTSGHSAFSAAGAEILELFTGSDAFGASVTFPPGSSRFEPGVTPVQETTLAWDTFTAAADEAGISRLYGGIHFDDGDLNGRLLGSETGQMVFATAQSYIDGTADDAPLSEQAPGLVQSIARFYETALDRRADFEGLNFWIDRANNGGSLDGIADAFLSSPEYTALDDAGAANDSAFVLGLFENLGEANPAQADIDAILAVAGAEGDRGDILVAMADSDAVAALTTDAAQMSELAPDTWWFA